MISVPSTSRRIALRADMDALPMAERTGAPYESTMPNVAHACGHDAHTAVLLGPALALASVPELPVGVRLIFQAAEELMPGGAIDAIAAGAMTGVSRIFALHCDPRLEVGKVAVRQGPITSAADQIEITLYSPGGHTSRPHLTADLVYGLGTLITGLPGVLSRRIDPRNSTVLVWGAVNAGVAPNAIPQTGVLAGTVRTASRHTWVDLEELVREAVAGLLSPLAIEHTLQYRRGVPPVVNEDVSTRILTHAIEAVGPDALADTRQSGGGEDFSWYLEEIPGAMARLGVWSGEGPQLDLHQPTFDLDERALADRCARAGQHHRAVRSTTDRERACLYGDTPRRNWQSAHARRRELCVATRCAERYPACMRELDRLLAAQGGVVHRRPGVDVSSPAAAWRIELKYSVLQKIWYGIYGRGEVTDALRLRGLDLATGTKVAVCLTTAAVPATASTTEVDANLHVLNPDGRRLRLDRRPGRAPP